MACSAFLIDSIFASNSVENNNNDFSERTPLITQAKAVPKDKDEVDAGDLEPIQMRSLRHYNPLGARTPQEKVFYDKNLIHFILELCPSPESTRDNLALTNVVIYQILKGSDKFKEAFNEIQNRSFSDLYIGFRNKLTFARQYVFMRFLTRTKESRGDAAHPESIELKNLSTQYRDSLWRLLHEGKFRNGHTKNISARVALLEYFMRRDFPGLTFRNPNILHRLWDWHTGYHQNSDCLHGMITTGSFFALLGGGIYTIVAATQYEGTVLSSSCLTNVITTAQINYYTPPGGFHRRYEPLAELPQVVSANLVLRGILAPVVQSLTVAGSLGIFFCYPHKIYSCCQTSLYHRGLDYGRSNDLVPYYGSPHFIQDLDCFLVHSLSRENAKYIPASHLVMFNAIHAAWNLRGDYMDLEKGNPLDPRIRTRIELLTKVMRYYEKSPLYWLLGGPAIRKYLINKCHIFDDYDVTWWDQSRVALGGDYLLRYGLMAAMAYSLSLFAKLPIVGSLMEVILLGQPNRDIGYQGYLALVNDTNCCITDATNTANVGCPILPNEYASYAYMLANSTTYHIAEWRNMVLNIPMMCMLISLFFWIIG